MSLLKSLTLTPARLAANRRNAQKSTGPRTVRGKAQSRMNALRNGWRSPAYVGLWRALWEAPPCSVDKTASAVLPPDLARHPLFAHVVDMFRQAEIDVVLRARQERLAQQRKLISACPSPATNVRSKCRGDRQP